MEQALTSDAILEAFPLRPVPHYRLSDAIVADDFGSRTNVFDEQWETWDQIETWQVAKCEVFFSYAPPNAAVYLTPRFMVYVLDEVNDPASASGSNTGDFFVWWLQRLKRSGFKGVPFSYRQRSVIELFLQCLESDPNYRITLETGNA